MPLVLHTMPRPGELVVYLDREWAVLGLTRVVRDDSAQVTLTLTLVGDMPKPKEPADAERVAKRV